MFSFSYDGNNIRRGCCERSDENLYEAYPPQERRPQRLYRSHFASKVRVDLWCQRTGCYQTMGPARVPYSRPEFYLRKHSRLPPVFFDPNDLKIDKSSLEDDFQKREELQLHKSNLSAASPRRCYPPPPKDMGLFRKNTDPTYEELYRNLPPQPCWSNDISEMDILPPLPSTKKQEASYNGRVDVIQKGRRDFLQENALRILRMPGKRPVRCYMNEAGQHEMDLSQGPFVLRPGFGQVPKYLERRRQELFEEEMELRRQMDDRPQCRPISNEEREFIIQGLEDHWSDLNAEYLRLPLESPSIRVNRLRAQLEQKFRELEDDIRLFKTTDELLVGAVNKSQYY